MENEKQNNKIEWELDKDGDTYILSLIESDAIYPRGYMKIASGTDLKELAIRGHAFIQSLDQSLTGSVNAIQG